MDKNEHIKVLKDIAELQIKGIDEGNISINMKSISKANTMLQLHKDITKVLMSRNNMICSQKYMTYMLRKEYEHDKIIARKWTDESGRERYDRCYKFMSFDEWLEKNDLNKVDGVNFSKQ